MFCIKPGIACSGNEKPAKSSCVLAFFSFTLSQTLVPQENKKKRKTRREKKKHIAGLNPIKVEACNCQCSCGNVERLCDKSTTAETFRLRFPIMVLTSVIEREKGNGAVQRRSRFSVIHRNDPEEPGNWSWLWQVYISDINLQRQKRNTFQLTQKTETKVWYKKKKGAAKQLVVKADLTILAPV